MPRSRPAAPAHRRLSADSSIPEAVSAWMVYLGASKPSPATLAAYRRDVEGIVARLAAADGRADPGSLTLADLERRSLRGAFSSWASDHAAASVRRAHSAWSNLFDFLVAEGVVEGNPMATIPKPKTPATTPRSIRARGAVERLFETAATADPRARDPWPARDLALVATFCVTGVREAEAASLDVGSLSGEPGARRMDVRGKGGKVRAIPVDATLDGVLGAYLAERGRRFPRHDLGHPATALFVDSRGRRLSVHQVRYLVERLYVRAGLRAQVPQGALVHALRHTFATSSLEAGADVVELQELLGHSSLETTRRYLSATAQGLRHVVEGHPGASSLRAVVARTSGGSTSGGSTSGGSTSGDSSSGGSTSGGSTSGGSTSR